MSYAETIKAAKLAARDVLRTRQVANRLNKVSTLGADKKALEESIKEYNEDSTIAVVEAENMPTAHPRRAKAIESAAKVKETNDKYIVALEKQMADLDKAIADVNAEIAGIEAGDGKILVNRDEVRDLANDFVVENYKDSFLNGDYAVEAKKAGN